MLWLTLAEVGPAARAARARQALACRDLHPDSGAVAGDGPSGLGTPIHLRYAMLKDRGAAGCG